MQRGIISICLLCSLVGIVNTVAAQSPGSVTGGISYTLPGWFKQSLLDIGEDVREARDADRHVVLFMHLDECPYCARMIRENFSGGERTDYVRNHFDVIGINVRGSLDVAWIDGNDYPEKALASKLGVFATPTLVLLDQQGGKALQLTGYRDPTALRNALEYLRTKSYAAQSFPDYLDSLKQPAVYEFRDHPQFVQTNFLKDYQKPLAVLIEDSSCTECARFHDNTLNHPDVLSALKPFLVVRLDAGSDQTLIDLKGNRTTSKAWVQTLGITYRPGLVLFDQGEERFRADGRLYHQHLAESLSYVGGGHYRNQELSDYRAAFRDQQLKRGIDVDFGE